MAKIRCGQVELNVVEQGEGRPLLLVHGFPLDHSMWSEQIAHFSSHFRVIAPDLRGFGASQAVPGTSSMEQMADDLAALLDALEIDEKVSLVGLSMGGYIAFQFWRKYANRLRGLVLCDTRAVADTPEAAAGRQKMIDEMTKSGPKFVADAMLPKLFAPAAAEKNPQIVAATRTVIENNSPEGIAAALRGLATRPDVTGELGKILVPTLVMVGEHDVISTAAEMRGIADAMPRSLYVLVPDAGHMSPLENPAYFNQKLEKFLYNV